MKLPFPLRPDQVADLVSKASSAIGVSRFVEWKKRDRGIVFVQLRPGPTLRDPEADPWTVDTLESALAILRAHYTILSIDRAVAGLRGEDAMPPSSLVLTASLVRRPDDVDLAAVAERIDAPIHINVSPGLLDRGNPPWPEMIRLAIGRVTADSVDRAERRFPLGNDDERASAAKEIVQWIYDTSAQERHVVAEELVSSWGIEPDSLPGLTWADVAELSRSPLVSIGAMGLTGDSLVRQPIDKAIFELREARNLIRDRTGEDALHMAYPWADRSEPVAREAERAGYRSATGGLPSLGGENDRTCNALNLATYLLQAGTPERVRAETCGLLHHMRTMGWQV